MGELMGTYLTKDIVNDRLLSDDTGITLIGDYTGANHINIFSCKNNHIFKARLNNVISGSRCQECKKIIIKENKEKIRKKYFHNLSQKTLKEILYFDEGTGLFKWKARELKFFSSISDCNRWNTRYEGKQCGSVRKAKDVNYIEINIGNKMYYAHRLVFLYLKGTFPNNQVDHINGRGDDNRLINLRLVSNEGNSKNKSIPKNNKSGVIGVYFSKKRNMWIAQISIDGSIKSLGGFLSFNDAVKARLKSEKINGYHYNHGRKRDQ